MYVFADQSANSIASLAVNMATYCGHYILSVKYNRRLSSDVISSVVCADQLREGRIALSLTGTFFLGERASTGELLQHCRDIR